MFRAVARLTRFRPSSLGELTAVNISVAGRASSRHGFERRFAKLAAG